MFCTIISYLVNLQKHVSSKKPLVHADPPYIYTRPKWQQTLHMGCFANENIQQTHTKREIQDLYVVWKSVKAMEHKLLEEDGEFCAKTSGRNYGRISA